MQLKGKVAAVTGGARGIGRAITERFLGEGARVVILERNLDAALEAADALSGNGTVTGAHLDVRDWAEADQRFEEIVAHHGRIDICVTSAGVQEIGPSVEITREQWDRVVDTNLTGLFGTVRAAGRHMIEQGGGSIVNISSASAFVGIPERAPYISAKAAVVGLTRVLGVEWADVGVRVNAIAPGWVGTRLVERAIDEGRLSEESIKRRTPMGRFAKPEEIAEIAVFLASPMSSYMTGITLAVDGGFSSSGR